MNFIKVIPTIFTLVLVSVMVYLINALSLSSAVLLWNLGTFLVYSVGLYLFSGGDGYIVLPIAGIALVHGLIVGGAGLYKWYAHGQGDYLQVSAVLLCAAAIVVLLPTTLVLSSLFKTHEGGPSVDNNGAPAVDFK